MLLYLLNDSFNKFPKVVDRTVGVNVMDQLGDDLSISVGFELVTFALKNKNFNQFLKIV